LGNLALLEMLHTFTTTEEMRATNSSQASRGMYQFESGGAKCIICDAMTRHTLLLALVFLFAGVASAQTQRSTLDLAHSRLVDLTYSFDENTVYWPTAEGFKWTKDQWGPTPGGYFYASASYAASEHGGTHIDSPLHFAEGQQATDEIPITRLIAPAVVIDVTAACDKDPDYLFGVDDITAWEKAHGRVPEGAIVLVRTGWGKYWPQRKRYLGTDERGINAVPKLHFPGISAEAARLLASARRVSGVGIDTASVDYGQSKKLPNPSHPVCAEHLWAGKRRQPRPSASHRHIANRTSDED
jgi:kynurenine formamidase